jgi:outer membrane receptor protein involved in Fe transport
MVSQGTALYAQTKKASVTGYVKDSVHNKPLAFATVSLFMHNDLTQPLKSTYTKDNGKFQLSEIDTGSYAIVISYTGFIEKQIPVQISGDGQSQEFNIVLSATDGSTLKGVTIVARRPLIEQSDDKVTFNVENDPMSKSQTAIDILRKTPFVSVDGDGNVQVNGQSNFKVLLNGRETAMFAQNVKEALKGFPGSVITKIEVITSPSAKYDAEGVGGIINIITKKKVVGYNGSIFTAVTNTGWYNFNTSFSAKFGKIGATVNYGGNIANNIKGISRTETTPFTPAAFTQRIMDGKRDFSNLWQYGNAELSWEMDSLNTISAYGDINGGWNKAKVRQTITTQFPAGSSTESFYDLDSRNEYPTKSIGADYIRKFNSHKDKEFSIRMNTEFGTSNTFLNSIQDNPTGMNDRFIENRSVAKNRQYTLQSDYTLPLGKGKKIEAGVKTIVRNAASDFRSGIKTTAGENYKTNPGNTDNFDYSQNVYSAYSTYYFKLNKTSFRLGARVEQTEVDGDFSSSKTTVKQSYLKVLPNVQISTKFNNRYTMSLNYSMRLQRPFINNLNPFVNNNDSLNISFGNPQLDAQTVHTLSVQNRYSKDGVFVGLTLSGSYSDNMIVPFATFDKTTGVTSTTSGNFGEEYQLNMSGNVNIKFNKDWSMSVNGNVRYNKVQNKSNSSQVNDGISGNANLNSNYSINKRFNTFLYAGFSRSPVTIQESFPFNHWYGLGIEYKMFKEKLGVGLNTGNFFKKDFDFNRKLVDAQFSTTTVTTIPMRNFGVNVSWRFGKLNESVSKKKGVSNDDLIKSSNN